MKTCFCFVFFFSSFFFFLVWPCACLWGSSGAWWSSSETAMICSLCPPSPHLLIPLPSTSSSASGFRWCCCTWPVSYSPPAMTGVSPKSHLSKTYLIQNLNVREVHQPYVPLLPGWEPLNRSLRHGGLLYLCLWGLGFRQMASERTKLWWLCCH